MVCAACASRNWGSIRRGFPDVLQDVPVAAVGLLTKDPVTGKIAGGEKKNPVQAVLVPVFLAVLLMMVVLAGAAPHLGAVAEDKMQRVFEMLLCSASSFELMMGKVWPPWGHP